MAKRMKAGDAEAKARGAAIGADVGALSGAVGAGAAFGAIVAGPVGAAGGAGMGAAGWGIGKAVGATVDQASVFKGVSIFPAKLLPAKSGSSCEQDEAAACIVIEDNGRAICMIYFYQTEQEARNNFDKWWCSRTMYTMQEGRLLSEVERGGWPWNQANISAAVRDLWAVIIPRPPCIHVWTQAGIDEARRASVFIFLGQPEAGEVLTDEQLEAFALCDMSVESMASEFGYLQPVHFTWTEAGIAAAAEAKALDILGSPAVGDQFTGQQNDLLVSTGKAVSDFLVLGYLQTQDR